MYYSSRDIYFEHPHTAKPVAKVHLKDLGMDVRIILNLRFNKPVKKAYTGLIWLGVQRSGGLL